MTPAARIAAASEILDRILEGMPAEKALLAWSRSSRFAGSGDRAAVRDHVFDALRCRRSYAAWGGGATGRGLMLGQLRAAGQDPDLVFTGQGHAPAPLTAAERQGGEAPRDAAALDAPDWLMPELRRSLGALCEPVLERLRHRAPVFLRVAAHRVGRDVAQARLAEEGISAVPHPLSATALEVTQGARRVMSSQTWRDGWIEVQDAASQAVSDRIALGASGPVLDYCAGGGGKALALAALGLGPIDAHDLDPGRMRDLPVRAERAQQRIRCLGTDQLAASAPYRLVVADVPCSGSGAWRRQPEAKWRLTSDGLQGLRAAQADVLDRAAALVAPEGRLAYVTCSLLRCENDDQVDGFLDRFPDFYSQARRTLTPLDGGDGFFVAILQRKA